MLRHRRTMLSGASVGTRRRSAVVAVAALMVCAVVGVAGATPPPTNGLVAYHELDANGQPQIWAVAPDGSHQSQLTNGDACEGCFAEAPEWTPDGSRIYFDSDRAGNVHIFSMKPDGSDVQQVTSTADGFEGYVTISPDGTRIAYDGQTNALGTDQGIYVANIDGSGAHRVTEASIPGSNSFGWDTDPDFGPNGQIAFVRFKAVCPPSPRCDRRGPAGFGGSIWIVRSDGTGLRRITDQGRNWSDPEWSPDGSKLLLQTYDDRYTAHGISSDIYVVDADGSHLHPLTDSRNGVISYTASWSPDGAQIVFHHVPSATPDHVELWVMHADGSDPHRIADCSTGAWCDWSDWGTQAATG